MANISGLKKSKSRLALVDLISYVILAGSIGLATSVTLAGVVMLLAQADDSGTMQASALAKDGTRSGMVERPTLTRGNQSLP